MIQDTTQASTAVRPSALGAAADTKLNMLTNTRNKVTNRDIRPQTKFVKQITYIIRFGEKL